MPCAILMNDFMNIKYIFYKSNLQWVLTNHSNKCLYVIIIKIVPIEIFN